MKYIFIIHFLILVSCIGDQKNFIEKTKTYKLVVKDTLSIKCDDLGNPCSILPYEDIIFLVDNSSRYLLTLHDLEERSITNVLEKGKAENEALIVTSIHKVGENVLYVYDDFGKKKIYFTIDSNQCHLDRISSVENFCASIETEDFIICALDSINNRFSVKDKRKDHYYSFGDFSLYENAQKSGVGYSDGLLVVNDQQNRFAWFSRSGASLCIASFNGLSGNIVYQKIFQEPQFETIKTKNEYVPIFSDKTIIGFTSVTTSRDYIFAMFNGKSFSEFIKNPKKDIMLCDNMCVFDWEGNLLGNIKLDINTKDIYYNRDTDKMNLIGINSRGECQIFSINDSSIYDAIKTFVKQ